MKKILSSIAVVAASLTLLFAAGAASATGGVVVSQTQIDEAVVNRIYLGQSRDLIAVNQMEDSAVRQNFESEVLGRSAEQLRAHWSRLIFTGRASALREVESDEAVLEFVRSNPGTIGYISDASKAGDLNIIIEF
ncbi:phosphate ABC transporter substrate-binding protein [Aliidiomarina minuta]|uniref:Phosphate ABC transporter substrate-binding protein n=1 Tax=Aliidiomarina minuta TaxID=880057 RepID=A0A432W8A9_9GAMM|nr:phosphate ABC transporter substrate-binding protein [Aliidiomarina minuta]RUO26292.1 phosphate ABC transporter substrate-binding protein [Aliidiomarina minuta]